MFVQDKYFIPASSICPNENKRKIWIEIRNTHFSYKGRRVSAYSFLSEKKVFIRIFFLYYVLENRSRLFFHMISFIPLPSKEPVLIYCLNSFRIYATHAVVFLSSTIYHEQTIYSSLHRICRIISLVCTNESIVIIFT